MVNEGPSPIVKTAIRFLWPLFALPYLMVKYGYKGLFGWWLDSWLTEKGRARLRRDIVDEMSFVASGGKLLNTRGSAQPFDYASVYLDLDNVRIGITRGQREISITLAPHASLVDEYEFGVVHEALACIKHPNQSIFPELREADKMLEFHWNSIKTELSNDRFSEFKKVLTEIKRNQQRVTREAQWELARHLGRSRR